jgi:hypothetical protein
VEKIEIVSYQNLDPNKRKVLAAILFDGKKIAYSEESSKALIHEWETFGVAGSDGKGRIVKVFPKDGNRFLLGLLNHYRTPYVVVETSDDSEKVSKDNSDW